MISSYGFRSTNEKVLLQTLYKAFKFFVFFANAIREKNMSLDEEVDL